jgi:hypothetical protein
MSPLNGIGTKGTRCGIRHEAGYILAELEILFAAIHGFQNIGESASPIPVRSHNGRIGGAPRKQLFPN